MGLRAPGIWSRLAGSTSAAQAVEIAPAPLYSEASGSDATAQQQRPVRGWLRDAVIITAAVLLFFVLSLQNITLPGLYYDEALDVVPAMQVLQGAPLQPVRDAAVTVGGRTLPLMVMDYVGTVNTYLALPIFAVMGVSVTSVRLLPILLAALSLILAYRLALQLFDWRVAAVTVLLAAVDPSYIFFSRMGIHVTSVMTVFALGSLLALLRWRTTGHGRWLGLTGLLLGLGLWAKVLFLWWIIALALGWLVWRLIGRAAGRQEAAPGKIDGSSILAFITGFLLGSAPLWLYNVMTGGTLTSFGRNAVVTEHGVNNLNILSNLAAAADSFAILLDGRYFWFLGEQFANTVNVIGFLAVLVIAVVLVRRQPEWRAGLGLVVTLIVTIVALSAITVSGIWATHLYILLPLPQMLIGVGLVLVADTLAHGRRWLQTAIIVIALCAGMAANYRVYASYETALVRSGGLSRFSDAGYRLADWLEMHPYTTVYAVDWGIQKNVQVLTDGRVNPVEIYGFSGEPPAAFVQRAEKALLDPSAVFILHSKEDTVYEVFALFQEAAKRAGVQLKIIDATRDRSGAPVHVMWVAEQP